MIPDERESLITGQRSLKAKKVKPSQVVEHQPHVIYISWPIFGIHKAKHVETIAPESPKLNLVIKSQESNRWIESDKAAKNAMIVFLLCDSRNIWQVNEAIKANRTGIDQ